MDRASPKRIKSVKPGTEVVAQLVERSIPTPENRRLDPDTDQKYNRKDGNLKNVPGNGSYLKKSW